MTRTFLLMFLFLSVIALPAEARRKGEPRPPTSDEQAVLQDLEKILDLWRDGRFAELYDRTSGGRDGKERFARKLAAAPRKPACCWEKMQEARVSFNGDRAATVHAKLGFEGSVPGTEYVTKGVKLKREDSVWVISQSDLFSLADLSKKRTRYKYLPIQPK
ncbi:hypothetical protein GMLC_22950 [Geomonas limicola]|uniref:DUF4440 domain-containing protein n=1 Tax=Geomonas limicola TaxID=2740186 RepID=A0A6V8N808_9BACT|nr:hypothetical protein [Geomonas limicola]GFO68716.1 hypothetical protein GMLC_22950 [Geomonas limicola]